jgi:hypothetical protein
MAAPRSPLEFESSDAKLVQSFIWAKQEALSYVFEGAPVGPAYEASLPGRQAFCMRDVSHQAMGAQALGLSACNLNMQRKFAAAISDSKDWCAYWEIGWDGKPSPFDYDNDSSFWYDLPANFDLMDACYRMYLWTGDDIYLRDPVFVNFYKHTLTDYVERWQIGPDKVMDRSPEILNLHVSPGPSDRFPLDRGIPGYIEEHRYFAGMDLLATQYAALTDYAKLLPLMGRSPEANDWAGKAEVVKKLVNDKWWDARDNHFYLFIDVNRKLSGLADIDPLYYHVAEDGPKTQAALNDLAQQCNQTSTPIIEIESHYPEVWYRFGRPDLAYSLILDLTRPDKTRREYPENSYAVIGAMVTGLMGVNCELDDRPTSRGFVVSTLSGLTHATAEAEMLHIPVWKNSIGVKQVGNHMTSLTNESGPDLHWKAQFLGHRILSLEGRPAKAVFSETELRQPTTSLDIMVPSGSTMTVTAATVKSPCDRSASSR